MDSVLGIKTQGCRMEGTYEFTELGMANPGRMLLQLGEGVYPVICKQHMYNPLSIYHLH